MRSKLLQKLNYETLDRDIAAFMAQTGDHVKPFLIMSEATCKTMENDWDWIGIVPVKTDSINFGTGKMAVYSGCPIAFCDAIPFGEVEIR